MSIIDILSQLNRYLKQYRYGTILNDDGSVRNTARFNKATKEVEFVLWKAGEQGHKKDYWHPMGAGWITRFKPDNN